MSSKIIASTSSGTALNMSADTSGILEIQTGSTPTTAVYVDASQNVGIGTTPNAAVKLQVKTASNQDLAVVSSSFVTGGVGLAAVNDAYSSYTALDLQGSSIQMGTGGLERMRIDSSGNLLVGTTATAVGEKASIKSTGTWNTLLQIPNNGNGLIITNASGTASYQAFTFYNNGTTFSQAGYIQVSGTTTTYATLSDYRLKENVAPMQNALNIVQQLKPVTYNWKSNKEASQGFIAHELQAVVPDCVTGEKDAVDAEGKPVYQGIDTSFLVATLTAAIQELNAKVTALEAQLGAK